MKKMKCSQLGGPNHCEYEFEAENWEEMKSLSQEHGKEMMEKKDKNHLDAMNKIKSMMQDPDTMNKWMEEKRNIFENLSDN